MNSLSDILLDICNGTMPYVLVNGHTDEVVVVYQYKE